MYTQDVILSLCMYLRLVNLSWHCKVIGAQTFIGEHHSIQNIMGFNRYRYYHQLIIPNAVFRTLQALTDITITN